MLIGLRASVKKHRSMESDVSKVDSGAQRHEEVSMRRAFWQAMGFATARSSAAP
jgi:hypothetical protein